MLLSVSVVSAAGVTCSVVSKTNVNARFPSGLYFASVMSWFSLWSRESYTRRLLLSESKANKLDLLADHFTCLSIDQISSPLLSSLFIESIHLLLLGKEILYVQIKSSCETNDEVCQSL